MGHGAEMDGCGKCVKYLLFLFNFLALCGGLAVLAIGIWTCVDHARMEQLLGTNLYVSAAYILIATGIVVILVAFFGCMGAIKEIKCMLLTYFIIMFAIFVTMLVGGILAYAFRDKVKDTMRTRMFAAVREYDKVKAVTDAWDFTQETLKCCGVEGQDGYRVWMMENSAFQGVNKVPRTCCRKTNDGTSFVDCQRDPSTSSAYLGGCLDMGVQTIQNQSAILGGVGIGIAFIMLLGMIFSMALFKMIK